MKFCNTATASVSFSVLSLSLMNSVFAQNTANNEILVYPPKKPPHTKKWFVPLEFGEGRFTTGLYSGLNRFQRRRVDADRLDPFVYRPLPTRKRKSSSFKPGTWNWRPGRKPPAFSYKYKIINLTKDSQGSYEGMPGDYRQNYRPIPHVRFGGTFAPIPPLMGDPTQHRRGWYIKKYRATLPKKEQYNQYIMDIVNDDIHESYPSLEWVTYSWKNPHKWKYNLSEETARPRFGSYEAFSNYDSRFPAYEPKRRYEVLKVPLVPPIYKRSAEKEDKLGKAAKSIDLSSVPSKSEDIIRNLQSASSIMQSALRTAKLRQETESEISSSDYDSNEALNSYNSISLSSVYSSSETNSSSSENKLINSEDLVNDDLTTKEKKVDEKPQNNAGKKVLLFNANRKQQHINNMRHIRQRRSPHKESIEKLAKNLHLSPKKESLGDMSEQTTEYTMSIFRLEDQVVKQKQNSLKMHHNINKRQINSKWNDKHTRKRYNKLSRKLYTAQDVPLKTEEKISDTYVPEPYVPPIEYQPDSFWDSIYGRTKEKNNSGSSSSSDADSGSIESTIKPVITTMQTAPKPHPGIVLRQVKKRPFLHLKGKLGITDAQKKQGVNEEPLMEAKGKGDRGRREKKKRKLTTEEKEEKQEKKRRKGRKNYARDYSLEIPHEAADRKSLDAFKFPTFPPEFTTHFVTPRPYKQPTPYVQPTIPHRPPPPRPYVRVASAQQAEVNNAQHAGNMLHLKYKTHSSSYKVEDRAEGGIIKDNVGRVQSDMLHIQNKAQNGYIVGSKVDHNKHRASVIKDNADRIQSDMHNIKNDIQNSKKLSHFANIPHIHNNKGLRRSVGLPAVRRENLEHELRLGDDRLHDPEEISENDKAEWSIGPPLNESEPVLNTEERNYVPEGAYQFPHFRNPNFDPDTAYDENGVPIFMSPNYTQPTTLKGDRIFGLGRGMQHGQGLIDQHHNQIAHDLKSIGGSRKSTKSSTNNDKHIQNSRVKPNIMRHRQTDLAVKRQKRYTHSDESDDYGVHEPRHQPPPPQRFHHNDWESLELKPAPEGWPEPTLPVGGYKVRTDSVKPQYTYKPFMRRFGGRSKPFSRQQLRGGRYRFGPAVKYHGDPQGPFFNRPDIPTIPFEQLKYEGDFNERWTFTRPMFYRKTRASWLPQNDALDEWDKDIHSENIQPTLPPNQPIVTPHMINPSILEPTETTTSRHVTAYHLDLSRLVWPSYIKEVSCIPTFRTRPPMTSYTQRVDPDISVPDMWGKISSKEKKVGDFTVAYWGRRKIILEETEEVTPSYLNAEWQKLYAEVTDSNLESKFSDSETDYSSLVTEVIDTQTPLQKMKHSSIHTPPPPTVKVSSTYRQITDHTKQTTQSPTTHRSYEDEDRRIPTVRNIKFTKKAWKTNFFTWFLYKFIKSDVSNSREIVFSENIAKLHPFTLNHSLWKSPHDHHNNSNIKFSISNIRTHKPLRLRKLNYKFRNRTINFRPETLWQNLIKPDCNIMSDSNTSKVKTIICSEQFNCNTHTNIKNLESETSTSGNNLPLELCPQIEKHINLQSTTEFKNELTKQYRFKGREEYSKNESTYSDSITISKENLSVSLSSNYVDSSLSSEIDSSDITLPTRHPCRTTTFLWFNRDYETSDEKFEVLTLPPEVLVTATKKYVYRRKLYVNSKTRKPGVNKVIFKRYVQRNLTRVRKPKQTKPSRRRSAAKCEINVFKKNISHIFNIILQNVKLDLDEEMKEFPSIEEVTRKAVKNKFTASKGKLNLNIKYRKAECLKDGKRIQQRFGQKSFNIPNLLKKTKVLTNFKPAVRSASFEKFIKIPHTADTGNSSHRHAMRKLLAAQRNKTLTANEEYKQNKRVKRSGLLDLWNIQTTTWKSRLEEKIQKFLVTTSMTTKRYRRRKNFDVRTKKPKLIRVTFKRFYKPFTKVPTLTPLLLTTAKPKPTKRVIRVYVTRNEGLRKRRRRKPQYNKQLNMPILEINDEDEIVELPQPKGIHEEEEKEFDPDTTTLSPTFKFGKRIYWLNWTRQALKEKTPGTDFPKFLRRVNVPTTSTTATTTTTTTTTPSTTITTTTTTTTTTTEKPPAATKTIRKPKQLTPTKKTRPKPKKLTTARSTRRTILPYVPFNKYNIERTKHKKPNSWISLTEYLERREQFRKERQEYLWNTQFNPAETNYESQEARDSKSQNKTSEELELESKYDEGDQETELETRGQKPRNQVLNKLYPAVGIKILLQPSIMPEIPTVPVEFLISSPTVLPSITLPITVPMEPTESTATPPQAPTTTQSPQTTMRTLPPTTITSPSSTRRRRGRPRRSTTTTTRTTSTTIVITPRATSTNPTLTSEASESVKIDESTGETLRLQKRNSKYNFNEQSTEKTDTTETGLDPYKDRFPLKNATVHKYFGKKHLFTFMHGNENEMDEIEDRYVIESSMARDDGAGEVHEGYRFVSEELELYGSPELINANTSSEQRYVLVSPKPKYKIPYKWINFTDVNHLRNYYYKSDIAFRDSGNYSLFWYPKKPAFYRKVKSALWQAAIPVTESLYRRPFFNFRSDRQQAGSQQGFQFYRYQHTPDVNSTEKSSALGITLKPFATDTNFADKEDDFTSDEGADAGIIKDILKDERLQGIKYMEERTKYYNKTLDILFTRNLFINFSDIYDTGYGRYSSVINKWYNKTFVPKYRVFDLRTPEFKNQSNRGSIYYSMYLKKLNAISRTYTHVLLTQLNGTASNSTDVNRYKIRIPGMPPKKRRFPKKPLWVQPYYTPKVLFPSRNSSVTNETYVTSHEAVTATIPDRTSLFSPVNITDTDE